MSTSELNTNTTSNAFPLYDLLVEKTTDVSLTQTELVEFIQNVRKMDKIGFDYIFIIIRIYSYKNSTTGTTNDIPYLGQKIDTNSLENKSDVKFDIRNFPNKLNQMLFEFTKMHLLKES